MRKRKPPVKKHPLVIGLDLSITSPGLCIGISPDNFSSYLIKTPPAGKFGCPTERFNNISELILDMIVRNVDPSQYFVVIEDYAYGATGHTFAIAENGGTFKHKLFYELGVPFNNLVVVSPGQLKKFVAGIGNAGKDVMIKEVYKRWGFDTRSNDEADAFGLYQIGLCLKGISEPQNQKQKEVIKEIRKRHEQI